jgi:pilus assembly protein CpaB
MRAKTILMVLFLVSVGVAAVIFLRAMSLKMPAQAAAPEVLVAAVALPPGALLRAEDVIWRPAVGAAAAGTILRPDEAARQQNPLIDEQTRAAVYGAALRVAIASGEPIRPAIIAKPGDSDFLQVVLTPGKRAIAIPVKTGGASAGLLDPGDHVDVILTQTFRDNGEPVAHRSVAETVVEDLRVLATDAPATRDNAAAAGDFGRTVTLEVTPEQAQKINVATELGRLSLTLRPNGNGTTLATARRPASSGEPAATWAGDVSPALGSMTPPPVSVVADPPEVKVMRGNQDPQMVKLH